MKHSETLLLISVTLLALAGPASAGETLDNGIVLPDHIPGRRDFVQVSSHRLR
jgi:hypothetical protein